jgi:putative flippase GtrA
MESTARQAGNFVAVGAVGFLVDGGILVSLDKGQVVRHKMSHGPPILDAVDLNLVD